MKLPSDRFVVLLVEYLLLGLGLAYVLSKGILQDPEMERMLWAALILYVTMGAFGYVGYRVIVARKPAAAKAPGDDGGGGNPPDVPVRRRFAVGRAARNVLIVLMVAAISPIVGVHLPAPWNDIYFGVTIVGILASALVFWICKLGRIP